MLFIFNHIHKLYSCKYSGCGVAEIGWKVYSADHPRGKNYCVEPNEKSWHDYGLDIQQ